MLAGHSKDGSRAARSPHVGLVNGLPHKLRRLAGDLSVLVAALRLDGGASVNLYDILAVCQGGLVNPRHLPSRRKQAVSTAKSALYDSFPDSLVVRSESIGHR